MLKNRWGLIAVLEGDFDLRDGKFLKWMWG
jgi:hypothetical protein